ncbi:MAG: serine/threonine protein kinase [Armatimonadetes bacterium]|nr:serine/threonine protein kinase [Armatimonadota bacterium]
MSSQPSRPPPGAASDEGRVALPPGTLLSGDTYEVHRVIGYGGFSLTYFGIEPAVGLPLAIKEFFPSGCQRNGRKVVAAGRWVDGLYERALKDFLEEARTLERFVQPGIVKVYSVFEENNTAYIAMEFLRGKTVAEFLKEIGGRLPEGPAIQIVTRVGQALEAVHLAGLLHGDIKPENILLNEDGRVVLLDFGASRKYLRRRSSTSGPITLTPGYAPPEQHSKKAALGPYTDVYALAATLYHLLTGQVPPAARYRIKTGQPVPPLNQLAPGVNRQVEWAVQEGLQLEVGRRPQTMRDFLNLLLGEQLIARVEEADYRRLHQGGHQVAVLQGHTNWVVSLDFSPDGSLLASGSADGTVRLWRIPEGHPLGAFDLPGPVNQIQFSPDGKVLAAASQNGHFLLLDARSGRPLAQLRGENPAVHSIAFSPDSLRIMAGLANGAVQFFQQPGELIGELRPHQGPVNAVACSPDGHVLASASNDRTVVLSDLYRPGVSTTLTGHTRIVQSVDFSKEGKLLASASNDMTIRIWDARDGREVRILKGHSALVWAVRFTPDSNILVSASGDKTIRLWRLDSARDFLRLEGHQAWVRALACSPTQRLIASGGGDQSIRLWHVPW